MRHVLFLLVFISCNYGLAQPQDVHSLNLSKTVDDFELTYKEGTSIFTNHGNSSKTRELSQFPILFRKA